MAKRNDDTLYDLIDIKETSPFVQKGNLRALIREAHSLRGVESRLKEIKSQIAQIVQEEGLVNEHGVTGVRDGQACIIVRWQEGRETFNKEKAVEAGITPAQIRAAMVKGKAFQVVEMPVIGEGE